jgi:nuclear pore complex protein Nup62
MAFSFGNTSDSNKSNTPAPAGGFSFDATNAPAPAGGGFSFGGDKAAAAPAGGFSFGSTTATPAASDTPAPSGGFNFAASSDTASKPSFGFGGGTSTADGKVAPSFGTTNTDSTAASKPTCGFGSTAASADDKQAPSFGVTTDSAKTAGGFSFGKTDSDAAAATKPPATSTGGFSFAAGGGTEGAKTPAPAASTGGGFSFGGSDDTANESKTGDAPSTVFSLGGSATTSNTPAPATTTNTPANTPAPAPSAGGFSFGSPNTTTNPTTPAAAATTPATPAAGVSTPATPAAGVTTPARSNEPTPLQYQTLSVEEILNKFQAELEQDVLQYTREAERIARYDAILRDSQRNLLALGNVTSRLFVQQTELESTLKSIDAFQTELDSNLVGLEQHVDELFAAQAHVEPQNADKQRELAYSTAVNIDERLSLLSEQLTSTMRLLDDSQDKVLTGSVGDVVRILNAHQNGLAELEQTSRSMEQDFAQIGRYLAQPR